MKAAQDYKAKAPQTEINYQRDNPSRWWNRPIQGTLKPLYLMIAGLGITLGTCYFVVDSLSSKISSIETISAKVTDKKYDQTLPSYVWKAVKIDEKGKETPIVLWNKNSNLEHKLNDSDLQAHTEVNKKIKLRVARSRNYPDNVYGNVLDVEK
jgi:hypothetical protein